MVVVEGYTDVMAMHLAGVTTAVASCGTAFGTEHVSVIRRLIGDDSFDRGEVIYTFDGDAAGQSAAMKAFEGDQNFAAQTSSPSPRTVRTPATCATTTATPP
ncbi:toprim domain-containing protein [Pseudonocardia sp. ICBG601]|uniref:toprim domain-containing protein n=1 Tax=Pseudonocardia sp. ICBG601 TaxID=2846759 RepID=UPI001CF627FF|nr:toprim domain-containing protein [Pseudonocardia sp. ICBG601]